MPRSAARRSSRVRPSITPIELGIGVLVAVCIVASLAFVGVWVEHFARRDWHTVATVNDASISRSELRTRVRIEQFLADLAARHLDGLRSSGARDPLSLNFAAEELTAVPDPLTVAMTNLVDERLLWAEAERRNISLDPVDIRAEVAHWLNAPLGRQLRYVVILRGAHSAEELATAAEEIEQLLAEGADLDAIDAALGSDWQILAGDRWIASAGPQPGIDADAPIDELVAAARAADAGTLLGPFIELPDRVSIGRLLQVAAPPEIDLEADLAAYDIGLGDLGDWAAAQVLRRQLRAELFAELRDAPIAQASLDELVLGRAAEGDPDRFVQLEHLVVAELPADELPAPAGRRRASASGVLADELAGLEPQQRATRFAALMSAANADDPTGIDRSGDVGFVSAEQLISNVAALAFAPGAEVGDVVGPLETDAGPELFRIAGYFEGALDERSGGALLEAREPGADRAELAERLAPTYVGRLGTPVWRTELELGAAADALAAAQPDPYVAEGLLIQPQLRERRTAPPTERQLAVIGTDVLERTMAAARDAADIWIDPDPLPELGAARTSAPLPSAVPLPSVDQPALPSFGAPAPTPGGLPVMPTPPGLP